MAHAAGIFVEVRDVITGEVSSHLYDSEYPSSFFVDRGGYPAEVAVHLQWCPCSSNASSTVPFSSVPGSRRRLCDQFDQALVFGRLSGEQLPRLTLVLGGGLRGLGIKLAPGVPARAIRIARGGMVRVAFAYETWYDATAFGCAAATAHSTSNWFAPAAYAPP